MILTCFFFSLQSSKPMMEKRRRARINQSLNELKALILEAMKKDVSQLLKYFGTRTRSQMTKQETI